MGFSQEQAVRIAFKRTFYQLDTAMRDYVEKDTVRRGFYTGPAGLNLPTHDVKARRLDRAAATAVLADVIPRFLPWDSAATRELVATNLAVNPDDPNAYALDLEYKPVSVRDALAKLTELEHRFPNHPRLLALHGDILANAVIRYRATGATGWEPGAAQARELYRRSIAASAYNPRAYTGLGELYAAMPDVGPIDEGIAALDTAVIYENQPRLFRALADLYLRDNKLEAARLSMRNAVAFNTHEQRPFDVLLLENLELLVDLAHATPTPTGPSFKSGATYTGTVRDGKPEGTGTWLRQNGSSYTGEFKDGLPAGRGTLRSERGDIYDGNFRNGFAFGRANMNFAAGKMKSYNGDVANATPEGKGVLVTDDGRVEAVFRHGVATPVAAVTVARAK
jgi:hypothetical protein